MWLESKTAVKRLKFSETIKISAVSSGDFQLWSLISAFADHFTLSTKEEGQCVISLLRRNQWRNVTLCCPPR